VKALLGPNVTLGQAAVWPDCIRSVAGSPSTGYKYQDNGRGAAACKVFASSPSEVARMTDYASRNWTNCEYSGHNTKCNLSYHFADVNVHEHSDYNVSYFGAHPYDVVHAIEAAETVLNCASAQGCAAPAPFDIKDKREALFLLAHFVGDVHQPLHVGAVYLDHSNAEGDDTGAATVGGNWLLLPPSDKENLHASWDDIATGLGTSPNAKAVAQACQMMSSAPAAETPETWASESVAAANSAYGGMTFSPDNKKATNWDVQFENGIGYAASRKSVQQQRLLSAGVRLAGVLNALWPSDKPVAACKKTSH
jgi:hypothetical protein